MEGNRKKAIKARAILVFGVPCSGRTTFCENFSKQFRASYYDLDKIAKKYSFSRKQIVGVVEQLAKTGQTLVIEGGLDTEVRRQEIRNTLRKEGYEPTLIWMQTDITTIKMRLKAKLKSAAKAKAKYEAAVKVMEAPTEVEKPVVLSGKHTYATQSRHVIARLAQ